MLNTKKAKEAKKIKKQLIADELSLIANHIKRLKARQAKLRALLK